MSTLGSYQNDTPGLSSLDLTYYERIFKVFTDNNDGKDFFFYNILKKVSLPDNIDSAYLSFFKVDSPLALTIISDKIYNNIKLWWLIYLVNKDTIGDNIFVIPGGTQLKYIRKEILPLVFNQITKATIYNGKHY